MNTKLGTKTLESMSQAQQYNRWTLRKIDFYLQGDILEVGCGIGNFTKELIHFGNVFAIDIDKEYVSTTLKLLKGKAHIGFGDIEKGLYFFKSQRFDRVVCINVLEHIQDDDKALDNIYSLLKNEGYLILLVPAHQFLYGSIDKSIGHFRRYNKKSLIAILKNKGFKIEKVRLLNMIGAIGWLISSKLFSERAVDEKKIKIFNFIAPITLPLEDFFAPPFGTSILVIARKMT